VVVIEKVIDVLKQVTLRFFIPEDATELKKELAAGVFKTSSISCLTERGAGEPAAEEVDVGDICCIDRSNILRSSSLPETMVVDCPGVLVELAGVDAPETGVGLLETETDPAHSCEDVCESDFICLLHFTHILLHVQLTTTEHCML
jgi:hypothetical protein